ncbi:MAG: hypothetical protein M3392_13520 [Actinomycetota bacterium]|nr:hypothetical protein [Actinomycetota bacterium]MDQ5817919.1 hypothetical protein [Actinomycetota bacterium]MDQ5830137.1 hypothetical protein [Actinomycetota bacterium]
MSDASRDLRLEEIPTPPLFKLARGDGEDVFEEAEVGGESSRVGALFATRELAEEFSAGAEEFGMESFSGLEPRRLGDWGAVEVYAASGADYLLVVSERGTGLFHAGDVARRAAEAVGEIPFPLYVISDERGEAPLISVQTDGEDALVATLFSSAEKAGTFRERASHLDLPESLGTIEDRDGLRRHALVAQQAGATYAVIDPEAGLTEAIPVEELIG